MCVLCCVPCSGAPRQKKNVALGLPWKRVFERAVVASWRARFRRDGCVLSGGSAVSVFGTYQDWFCIYINCKYTYVL